MWPNLPEVACSDSYLLAKRRRALLSDRRVREAAESHFPRERRLSPLKPCSTENICGRLFLGAPPRANILLWYLVSLQSTVERTITPEAIYYLAIPILSEFTGL